MRIAIVAIAGLVAMLVPAAGGAQCTPVRMDPKVCKHTLDPRQTHIYFHTNSMPHRRTVVWKLRRGNATSLADIGNPLALPTPDPKVPSTSYAPTSYSLCLYETPLRLPVPPNPATEKLIFGGTVPPGRTCGSQACWEKIGDRYHYRDGHGDPDGLTKIQIRPGTEGKTILIVKGRGPLLGNALGGMPTFPFTVPLVVQLQGSNGTCWEAIYKHPVITDSTAFTAEGSTFPPTPRATATLILFPTPFATLTAGASTASPTATSTPGSTGGPASATPTPLSTPEPTETVHGTSSATQTPVSSPTGTGPTHTPIGVTPSPISTGVTPSPISTPVSLPHLLDPELAKAANKCQRAIKTAGAFFAVKSPAALARCTDAVLRCIQTKPNDPTCIPKATATCQMALKSIGATRAALTTTIVRKCGLAPLVASDLIDAEGLGYGDLAGACLSLGTNLADSVSVADCLARQHACEAQQLFDAQQPRGGELLRRAGVPLDLNSCLPDRGDKGDMGDPRGTGKLLVECMTRMEKAASKFLATQLLALQTCVGGLFACVQTKPDDEACLAKAGETCVKDLVLIHAAGTKMSAAIDRKCAPTGFNYSLLRLANGGNVDALKSTCSAYGVANLNSLADYEDCLRRRYTCGAEKLLGFEIPRANELLANLAPPIQLDSSFCPTPSATP